MIIYVTNVYMEAEIEYMFQQSKKKPTKEAVGSVYSFTAYLQHQLLVLHANLKINIFRRVLLRIWKVILEDIIDIIIPSHGQSVPSLAQICVLEDLMDGIKAFFSKYGMSPTHLTQKIQEMHQLARKSANADELANTRVIYIEQKDKFEKKKSDSKKGIRKQPSKFPSSVSESSESYADHSEQPTTDSAPAPHVDSSMGSNDLSSTTDSDDDSENPPFPKIVPQRREPRRGALSGGVDVEAGNDTGVANSSGIIEKDDPDNVQLSRQSSGQADTIAIVDSPAAKTTSTKKRPNPSAVREIAGASPVVDTDDVNGGVSETDNILQRRGGKGRYYDETEREETATERDTDSESDADGNPRKRGVRRPVMLKIVAGGVDARAARRRAQQESSNKAAEATAAAATSSSKPAEVGAVDDDGQPLSEDELNKRLEEKLERLATQQASSKPSPAIAVMALTSDDGSKSSSASDLERHSQDSPREAFSPRSDNEIDSALKAISNVDPQVVSPVQVEPTPPVAAATPTQQPARAKTSRHSSRQTSPQKDETAPAAPAPAPETAEAAPAEDPAAKPKKSSGKKSKDKEKEKGKKVANGKEKDKKSKDKKKKLVKSPSGALTDGSNSGKKSSKKTQKKKAAAAPAPVPVASIAVSRSKPRKKASASALKPHVDSSSDSGSNSPITRALGSGRVSSRRLTGGSSSDSESSEGRPMRKFTGEDPSSSSSSPAPAKRSVKHRKPTKAVLQQDSLSSSTSSNDR